MCEKHGLSRVVCPHCDPHKDFVRVPELSDLIDACRGEFYELALLGGSKKEREVWQAKEYTGRDLRVPIMCRGESPDQAVKNLYIQLHKK